jgi:hypothetical protein
VAQVDHLVLQVILAQVELLAQTELQGLVVIQVLAAQAVYLDTQVLVDEVDTLVQLELQDIQELVAQAESADIPELSEHQV